MRVKIGTLCLLIPLLILVGSSQSTLNPQQVSDKTSNDESHLMARAIPRKPANVSISPQAEIDRVIIKLVEGTRARLAGHRLVSLGGKNLRATNQILQNHSRNAIGRLTDKSPERLEREKFLLENRCGRQLADFNNYFSVPVSSVAEAEELVNRLNRLPEVEIAYAEPRPAPAIDIFPPTPDYDTLQRYLRPAPGGVDADYAQTVPGGDGSGIRVVDVEGNWRFDHEDLESAPGGLIGGELVDELLWRNHGTAVIGVMVGGDNGYGVTGIVPNVNIDMVSIGGIGTTEALLLAVDSLTAGDIILVELHAAGPRYNFQNRSDQLGYICMEYWQANFDVIQLAWAKGIIVCEAAGNGWEHLDDPIYENRFDTAYRNSHAILIGAGAPPSGNFGIDRSRLEFSNWGERVNLQGYGREVVTTGFGYLFSAAGDERQYYIGDFTGTSAAAPIVTGAVAALQGIYKARYSALMDVDRIRDVLIATGSPQQPGSYYNIGPRPNLRAADSALAPPPDLFVDPLYYDTSVAVNTQLSVFLDLHNRAADKTLEYAIVTTDSMAKNPVGDWLTVPSPTGIIAPTGSEMVEIILDGAVIEDRTQVYKGLLEISCGQQGGPLDQKVLVPVFLAVPCADTTYRAVSSSDPGGPEFSWIDITTTGIEVPSYSWYNDSVSERIIDDGTAGPYTIGFSFPFYDSIYTKMYIGANGALSFTDNYVNVGGFYLPVPIPNPPFATFVAPFWCDLNLDPADGGHGKVYIYRSSPDDTLIIEFYRAAPYAFPADTSLTFEVILTRNGNITFQYLSVGDSGMTDSATVGIAEYDCASVPYVLRGNPPDHLIADSTALFFDYSHIIWEVAGDANSDGSVNVGDGVFMINWIFRGGQPPKRLKEADPNCDGLPNVGDAVYIINYVFSSGAPPCSYEL